jgi:hypothetical protein
MEKNAPYAVPEYKMNRQMAELLVDTFLEQFQQMPFHRHIRRMQVTPKQKEKLIANIEKTPAWNHPKKMQFEVPGEEKESAIYHPENLATQIVYPRRVFTNYDRPTDKSFVEEKWGDLKEWLYDRGKSTFDAQVICREMRAEPQITRIRNKSLETGTPCSLMIHFYATLPESGKHGGETHVHVPLFAIPEATKEDLETLSVYSMWHQHARPEIINTYIRHGVFNSSIDDRYFDYLEKFEAKAKLIKDELTHLTREEKEENIARIKELQNHRTPFLGD